MTESFELHALRGRFAGTALRQWSPNTLRGAVGAALKRAGEGAYQRYFAPRAQPGGGPSGFADPPRPFVLRAGAPLRLGINLFDTHADAIHLFTRVMRDLGGPGCCVEGERVRVSLAPLDHAVARLRVRFLTPTELKGTERPEFGVLLARIRDRISTLRALYGPGPLAMDFHAFGERAARVAMTRCEVRFVEGSRTSRGTGQSHSLGGFTGLAEYEGNLGEFVPFLEAARWTGAGRQTVWGKGEICVEEI